MSERTRNTPTVWLVGASLFLIGLALIIVTATGTAWSQAIAPALPVTPPRPWWKDVAAEVFDIVESVAIAAIPVAVATGFSYAAGWIGVPARIIERMAGEDIVRGMENGLKKAVARGKTGIGIDSPPEDVEEEIAAAVDYTKRAYPDKIKAVKATDHQLRQLGQAKYADIVKELRGEPLVVIPAAGTVAAGVSSPNRLLGSGPLG